MEMHKISVQTAALVVALGAFATIAGAWWFELVAGLEPCPLCLEQRLPYYVGIPVAVAAFALARSGRSWPAGILLAVFALLMAYGTGLGIYHSGIEWQWWAGPAACSGGGEIPSDAASLLGSLSEGSIPSCDEAPWRLFGLSLAGYNVLLSAALALIATASACRALVMRGH